MKDWRRTASPEARLEAYRAWAAEQPPCLCEPTGDINDGCYYHG